MDELPEPGLYIVATPIGNLGDITLRACEVLRTVAAVACEDTRVTGKLLKHLGIKQRLIGYRLVVAARTTGISVTSLPGASAAITALTLSGLPSDRFLFAGFLPAKAKGRGEVLAELSALRATLVFYETGPRLTDMLAAVGEALPGRDIAVARELTKLFEECRNGSAQELIAHYAAHPPKGEIVVLVGPPGEKEPSHFDIDALLLAELASAKPSQAASKVAKMTGQDRKILYARALELK
jgi:16S rRNA (cytidine1402-2'-O)-methyltransferase